MAVTCPIRSGGSQPYLESGLSNVPAHHSADETKLSKKLFKDWTEACTKIGLGEHDTKFIDDPQEAERLSRLKDVTSVHVRPSGSVHP